MALLSQLYAKLITWKRTSTSDVARVPTREEHLSRALGKVEPYVVLLQSILIWENPTQSLLCILGFNALFWLVVSLELRFYFLLFGTTLVVLVYEMWVEKVWPEIRVPLPAEQVDNEDWTPLHPRVLSAPELSHYLNSVMQFAHNYYNWLKTVRQEQPGLFCGLISTLCIIWMWVGWYISGTTLLYLLLMSLILAPGVCIHVLPYVAYEKLCGWQNQLTSLPTKDSDSDVEEYLPEPSGENLALLHQAGEPEHSDHEDEEEEFNMSSTDLFRAEDMMDCGPSSLTLIKGISSMPAPEDLSLDSTDFSFDLPNAVVHSPPAISVPARCNRKDKKRKVSILDVDTSSDSDDDTSPNVMEGIHFQTGHFKKDSSSEEEVSFSKTSRVQQVDNTHDLKRRSSASSATGAMADAAAAVLSYSSAGAKNLATLGAAMGQSFISSVITGSTAPTATNTGTGHENPTSVREEESDPFSDTDDFEMISEEEFANL